jgi:hypothetical protein
MESPYDWMIRSFIDRARHASWRHQRLFPVGTFSKLYVWDIADDHQIVFWP